MQTLTGRTLLRKYDIDPENPTSFLLLEEGRGHTDTDAIIRVLRGFGGVWRALAAIIAVVPRAVRDAAYRWVARNRYRLFGRREQCMMPNRDVADRFLS